MIWALLACAPALQPAPEQTRLRVLTWNLHYDSHQAPGVEDTLRALDADLVLLQETNADWQARLGGLYPHELWTPGPNRGGGVAVLSRLPVELLAEHRVVDALFPAQRLAVGTGFGEIQVLNLHLQAPFAERGGLPVGFFTTKATRKEEVAQLLELGVPDLACGDLNANEREPSLQQFEDHGMVSALPEFAPQQRTWHGPGELPMVWRIDHCMVGPSLQATEADVLKVGPSDHWPLVVGLAPS